jgi:hypothetical protein
MGDLAEEEGRKKRMGRNDTQCNAAYMASRMTDEKRKIHKIKYTNNNNNIIIIMHTRRRRRRSSREEINKRQNKNLLSDQHINNNIYRWKN